VNAIQRILKAPLLAAGVLAAIAPACVKVHVDPVEVKPVTLNVNLKYVDEKLDKYYAQQPNLQGPTSPTTHSTTTNSNTTGATNVAIGLRSAKAAGKIGESAVGLVEAVDAKYLADEDIKTILKAENSDRASLYEIIAKETSATPDVVAERAGERNFKNAKTGDYLKNADGTWHQKT
jgi:uncharacterized protein YdbL (DUF1318 family)